MKSFSNPLQGRCKLVYSELIDLQSKLEGSAQMHITSTVDNTLGHAQYILWSTDPNKGFCVMSEEKKKMKTPACRTSRESMGVQKSPNNFDLNLVTLTYDL